MNSYKKTLICTPQGGQCGDGICIDNGTACMCTHGMVYDLLLVEYKNCFMPGWVVAAFPISLLVLSVLVLVFALYHFRVTPTGQSRSILATSIVAPVSVGLYSIVVVATASRPNAVAWAIYFAIMVIHACCLVPLVARHIVPPAFQMIFMYPRWFDGVIFAYMSIVCVSLVYTWIFSMIALSYGNNNMFNDGVTIWYGSCGIAACILTIAVLVATQQLIEAIDTMQLKPFYRDLDVLRARARRVQVMTLGLGITSIVLLFIIVILHYSNQGIFQYRFVLTWMLFLMLLLFDAVVVWFARASSSKNILSTPKSNMTFTDDDEDVIDLPSKYARTHSVSFSRSSDIGGIRRDSGISMDGLSGSGTPRYRGEPEKESQVVDGDDRFVDVAVV